jgi:hypothetical protein
LLALYNFIPKEEHFGGKIAKKKWVEKLPTLRGKDGITQKILFRWCSLCADCGVFTTAQTNCIGLSRFTFPGSDGLITIEKNTNEK